MTRWLRSLFAWRHQFRAGVYDYFENRVTGERRAYRWCKTGHSPLYEAWLNRTQGR